MLMLATPPLQAALPRRALEFAPSQDVCVNPSVYTSKTFFNDPTCSTTIPCYEEGFDQDLRQAGYTITADRMMNIYNRLVTNTPCFEMTTELNILGCKDMDSLIEANNETWTDYPIVRTCCYPNRYGLVTNILPADGYFTSTQACEADTAEPMDNATVKMTQHTDQCVQDNGRNAYIKYYLGDVYLPYWIRENWTWKNATHKDKLVTSNLTDEDILQNFTEVMKHTTSSTVRICGAE